MIGDPPTTVPRCGYPSRRRPVAGLARRLPARTVETGTTSAPVVDADRAGTALCPSAEQRRDSRETVTQEG